MNLIDRALIYATEAHSGVTRKGTNIPYIFHCSEAAAIVADMTDDEDVIAAAVLHDVVEDTEHTISDVRAEFGDRIAELVSYETEDKMRDIPAEESWETRKKAFLEELKTAPIEAKMITLADKLSNMRMTKKTFKKRGNDMWLAFNQKDPAAQSWYYKSIADCIPELSDTEAYKEYVEICLYVFS